MKIGFDRMKIGFDRMKVNFERIEYGVKRESVYMGDALFSFEADSGVFLYGLRCGFSA